MCPEIKPDKGEKEKEEVFTFTYPASDAKKLKKGHPEKQRLNFSATFVYTRYFHFYFFLLFCSGTGQPFLIAAFCWQR